MKKLLGLLLNCVALCLCSAIGIGAGMYWMQNHQQNSASVPVVQQVQATTTQAVQQTPSLIKPTANKPISEASNIATTVPEERAEIQQVSLLYQDNDPKINRVEISQIGAFVEISGNEAIRKGPKESARVSIQGTLKGGNIIQLLNGNEIIAPDSHNGNTYTFKDKIKKTGTYQLVIKGSDKGPIVDSRDLIIKGQTAPPVITSLSDTTSPEIVYPSLLSSLTNSRAFGIPCFLLRGSDVTLNVFWEKGRNVDLEYRKIYSAPAENVEFKSIAATPTESSGKIELKVPTLSPGVYQFRLKDRWFSEPNEGISNIVTIAVPQPDAINPLKPSLTSYKNQLYSDEITAIPNPIQVFGGYLILKGKNANPKQPLKFEMFYTKDGHLEPVGSKSFEVTYQADQSGNWNATFKFGNTLTGPRTLYIVRQNEDQFAFSDSIPINLNLAKLPSNPAELKQFEIELSGKPKDLSNDAKIYLNTLSPVIKAKASNVANTQYLLYTDKADAPFGYGNYTNQLTAKIITPLTDGQHTIHVRLSQGDQISAKPQKSFTLTIQKNGFEVVDVQPPNFGTAPRGDKLKIQFSETNPLSDKDFTLPGSGKLELNRFQLIPSTGTNNFLVGTAINPTEGKYQLDDNSIILTFTNLPTNLYQLVIKGNQVTDIFGNRLEGIKGKPGTNYTRVLNKPATGTTDSEGTDSSPSKFIEYHDYEKREPPTPGFNPSDKVVTRVARLYYYRDAHRVAQILNSEVKSLNQKGYNEAQITADRARVTYEETVKKRRIQERKSIQAAKDLRGAENDYRTQQQILSGLVRERAQLKSDDESGDKEKLEAAITAAQGQITSLRSEITRLSGLMNDEDDKLQELTLDEENQSAELFRRELKAEKTDLYTIGNGDPKSFDAVRQVTIKVIGEGLIHLRGPIKGVNIVRTMINQIDSPVGQVRIAMHTIQINGEDGKRMEIVADRIQKSIDQSRFLTVQSSQMLRKAIVSVASQVAISTCQDGVALTQEQRDMKYLHAFFGQDFIEALRAMDSEFLRSGNKLLSIHSMDTTSLSSALFVLALAKNEIRQQILAQFYSSIETELPNAECQFLYQGGPTKATKHKHKLNLLSPYAHFQSFKGFFDHEVVGTDTMTPIQREFLRLAQIFKAKLTTEREYNLHVMERAVIEQNEGDYTEDLEKAREDEKKAEQKVKSVQDSIQKSLLNVLSASTGMQAGISQMSSDYQNISNNFDSFQKVFDSIITKVLSAGFPGLKIDMSTLEPHKRTKLLVGLFPLKPKSGSFIIDYETWDLIYGIFPVTEIIVANNTINKFSTAISEKLRQKSEINNSLKIETLFKNNNKFANPREANSSNDFLTDKTKVTSEFDRILRNEPGINLQNLNSMIRNNQIHLSQDVKNAYDRARKSAKNELNQQFQKAAGSFTYGDTIFNFKLIPINQNKAIKFELATPSEYKKLDQITEIYEKQAKQAIKEFEWFKLDGSMKLKLKNAKEHLETLEHIPGSALSDIHRIAATYYELQQVSRYIAKETQKIVDEIQEVIELLAKAGTDPKIIQEAGAKWRQISSQIFDRLDSESPLYADAKKLFQPVDNSLYTLAVSALELRFAQQNADASREKLDHKKFLDMQIDETEDKFIELVEGTRAHTANIDNYLKLIATALEDDFNTQFYYPAFKEARDASRFWNVSFGSIETSSILTNNRSLGKVAPKATIEFDLPKRQLAIIEGMNIAQAAVKEYGALVNDPTFLAITSMNGGENVQGGFTIQPDSLEKQVLGEPGSQGQRFGSAFENLIPDPAVFKFETGTGFTVRPVIQPDGQAVVFDLNYLYRTNVREPIRPDEKHLGRIKEHFIDTDVQLGNYELREISRFVIALKASRTANGVPLLSDVPGVGVLFRPTPSAESSLQQSQIMSQAVIYPTLFDLMGLRWAPAVADVGPLQLTNREFISKGRDRYLKNRVYDYAGSQVDKFLQIPDSERRSDLYRTQRAIPDVHPNGYMGPGLNLKRSTLEENFDTERMNPQEKFIPERNNGGAIDRHQAVPLTPPAEQGKLPALPLGNRSSAIPVKDSHLKPAGWEQTEIGNQNRGSLRNQPKTIFSPRKLSNRKKVTRDTQQPSSMREQQTRSHQENIQPRKSKPKSFYKRSAARFKSFFNKK